MKFSITGVNHKTAPLEIRERLAFAEDSLGAALEELRRRPGVAEGLILSTCNRVEVALTADEDADARAVVEEFLAGSRGVDRAEVVGRLYHLDGAEAIRHLFRVASSLDSMVVGEPQILGQLKTAYAAAKANGAVGGLLDSLVGRAFSVAKRVRSETQIGQSSVSVSSTAVELARQIFGSLGGVKVLLVGAGKMAELAARHLVSAGVGRMAVTNRTSERAEQMASAFGAETVPYEALAGALAAMDIVIASSAAPHYILTRDQMRRVIGERRHRPVFLIDIGVPRNIEPAVHELNDVFLYDIDDLQKVVDANRRGRLQEAEEAERIVAEEVERTLGRLKQREVAPTIVSLQQQLECIRAAELERVRSRLGGLTPQQEEALEALTRGIVNKIAHGPISELRRNAADPNGLPYLEVVRRVFRLDE